MSEMATRLLNPEKKQINPENFVCLQGWMISELHLKGASLIIYAIIYGFSQDGSGCFQGTATYLSEWACVSTNRVYEILKELCQMGLIEKIEKEINGVKVCDYRTNKVGHPPTKLATPPNKVGHPVPNKVGSDNINIHNIKDNIIISKRVARKRNPLQVFSNAILESFEKDVKTDAQKEIWFRRNCRNLKDILAYCNNDIELGLFTINETCKWLQGNNLTGGYEAVCRNLPEMYAKAMQEKSVGTRWVFSEEIKRQILELKGEKNENNSTKDASRT